MSQKQQTKQGQPSTEEQEERYARQRFLGLEVQKRLLNSLVLITPLNGPNTELAKNLVLSGVKIAVYDPQTITELDFETNFLVSKDSVGKNRGQILLAKLAQMNETVKHQLITEDLHSKETEFFQQFTLISTCTTSFKEMRRWDGICREINKPYFNLVPCGLRAFAYISLGTCHKYVTKDANSQKIKYGKDNKPVDPWINYDQVKIDSLTFDQALQAKSFDKKEIYHSILMMKSAQDRGLKLDPFNVDEGVLEQITAQVRKERPEKSWPFHTNFAKTFGVEFCPVYAVLGSVLSQEFIKITSQKELPAVNWFYYDSDTSIGEVLQLETQGANKEQRTARPDLREPLLTKK